MEQQGRESSTAYLLLELVPAREGRPLPAELLSILKSSLGNPKGKLAARICQAYAVTLEEFLTISSFEELLSRVLSQLAEPSTCNAAVQLILQFGDEVGGRRTRLQCPLRPADLADSFAACLPH